MNIGSPFSGTFSLPEINTQSVLLRKRYNPYGTKSKKKQVEHKNKNLKLNKVKGRVLVVDDDYISRSLIAKPLIEMGYHVHFAECYTTAINEIVLNKFDLIVLDWVLNNSSSGFDILFKLKSLFETFGQDYKVPVVTYSSCPNYQLRIPKDKHFEFLGHWQKPIQPKQIQTRLKEVLSK